MVNIPELWDSFIEENERFLPSAQARRRHERLLAGLQNQAHAVRQRSHQGVLALQDRPPDQRSRHDVHQHHRCQHGQQQPPHQHAVDDGFQSPRGREKHFFNIPERKYDNKRTISHLGVFFYKIK